MQHEHSSIRHAIEHRSRAQYVTAQPVRAQKDERSRIQHTIAGHSTPYHATATIAGHSRAQQGKAHGTMAQQNTTGGARHTAYHRRAQRIISWHDMSQHVINTRQGAARKRGAQHAQHGQLHRSRAVVRNDFILQSARWYCQAAKRCAATQKQTVHNVRKT